MFYFQPRKVFADDWQIGGGGGAQGVRLLDLFCGRWGWSRAFAARGWHCVGVDNVKPPEIPYGCEFIQANVLSFDMLREGKLVYCGSTSGWMYMHMPDFIVASSPCEGFSLWGMKHFHPDPPYPELGIRLFNHTRSILAASGVPYVMENVRSAQQFVGRASHHCGPFYLWGPGVPPLLNQGIKKGLDMGRDPITGKRTRHRGRRAAYGSKARAADKAETATIPHELANCVAEYAERLLEQKKVAVGGEGDSVAP